MSYVKKKEKTEILINFIIHKDHMASCSREEAEERTELSKARLNYLANV